MRNNRTTESLLSFVDFVESLGGTLRRFEAISEKRYATTVSVSSRRPILKTDLMNTLSYHDAKLSRLYFRPPDRSRLKIYLEPTLRMRLYGQPMKTLERHMIGLEQAILEA